MGMLSRLDQYKSGLQITRITCYGTCILCQCSPIRLETNISVHPVLTQNTPVLIYDFYLRLATVQADNRRLPTSVARVRT